MEYNFMENGCLIRPKRDVLSGRLKGKNPKTSVRLIHV